MPPSDESRMSDMEMLFRVGGPAAAALRLLTERDDVSVNRVLAEVRGLADGSITEAETERWLHALRESPVEPSESRHWHPEYGDLSCPNGHGALLLNEQEWAGKNPNHNYYACPTCGRTKVFAKPGRDYFAAE